MAYDATDFVVTETPVPVRDPKSITDPRERVAYLRDFLRALPPERFSMQAWGQNEHGPVSSVEEMSACGTRGCICGWAHVLFSAKGQFLGDTSLAGVLLGVSYSEEQQLFEPTAPEFGAVPGYDGPIFIDATSAQAANVLDNYLATGQIDWSVA